MMVMSTNPYITMPVTVPMALLGGKRKSQCHLRFCKIENTLQCTTINKLLRKEQYKGKKRLKIRLLVSYTVGGDVRRSSHYGKQYSGSLKNKT